MNVRLVDELSIMSFIHCFYLVKGADVFSESKSLKAIRIK